LKRELKITNGAAASWGEGMKNEKEEEEIEDYPFLPWRSHITLGNVVWQAQADLISHAQHDWHIARLLHILKLFTFLFFKKDQKKKKSTEGVSNKPLQFFPCRGVTPAAAAAKSRLPRVLVLE
jgi:hypothetical protein